jgi:hypothetical protein
MPRFKVEVINAGGLVSEVKHLDIDELPKEYPREYEAFVQDASCVGTMSKYSTMAEKITDRERWRDAK